MTFYLDNILINDQPVGDIVTTIKRDSQLGGFLITNDAKLKWHGDGARYIQSVIDSTGFCAEIESKINDDCTGNIVNIFNGKIFILEIEKNSNCIITAPLQDNDFYARISKNRNIEINIDTVTSKNGVSISAAATNTMTMFVPSTGASIPTTREGWRVYDIFTNLISFMSDGELQFHSTLFGLGGEFEGLSCTTGQELAFAGTGQPIKTSFSKFFDEVKKKTHCTLYVDTTGAIPTIRIEKYEELFKNTIIKKLEHVENVRYNIDTTKLISTITVGSTNIVDAIIGVSFTESNVYQTFKKEDYTTLGQCNTLDATLDLMSQFVISSNMIEDNLINGNGVNFSDTIHFIDCNNVVQVGTNYTSTAILGNPFNASPPYFFNTRLFNSEVLKRWTSVVPNSITNYSGSLNTLFRAANTSNFLVAFPTVYLPFQWDNDYSFPNFDTTNLYGNGTAQGTPVSQVNSRYTCPNNGGYIFFAQFQYIFICSSTPTPQTGNVTCIFRMYNAGGVLLDQDAQTATVTTTGITSTLQLTSFISKSFLAAATDYFEIYVIVGPLSAETIVFVFVGSNNETFLACVTAPNTGGIFITNNNQNTVPIIKADFEYGVKNSDFYDILTNPFGKIAFTYNINELKSGWIDTFQFNHFTSDSKITLLGKNELLL